MSILNFFKVELALKGKHVRLWNKSIHVLTVNSTGKALLYKLTENSIYMITAALYFCVHEKKIGFTKMNIFLNLHLNTVPDFPSNTSPANL